MGLINKLTNIATSISNKTGQPASEYTLDTMPSAIDSIQTSFPEPQEDESWAVRFVDYNGTIISEMTYTQAQALTSLPELPTHEGLTAIGWTSTLEEIQSVAEPDQLCVGVMYQTTDGINYFYLKMPKTDTEVTLNWRQTVANGVVIDWGDGSATETNSGTGAVSLTHTYSAFSEPTLTMQSVAGNTLTIGTGSSIFNNKQQYCLTDVRLASGVELGSYAFSYCSALQSITIPNSVTSISSYAFQDCSALQFITIPNSVTSIGVRALSGCRALQSITIPDSVTSIGSYAFYSCFALQFITMPNSVTSIGNQAFYSCSALQSITIPDSVTSIGSYAFYSCSALQSITIPNSVTRVDGDVFNSCYALQSITIPNSVTSISNYVFQNCSALQSITIPNSVTSIGSYVFNGCYNITIDLTAATKVPTASGDIFGGTSYTNHPTILVPSALLAEFQSATNWSTYAGFMKGV